MYVCDAQMVHADLKRCIHVPVRCKARLHMCTSAPRRQASTCHDVMRRAFGRVAYAVPGLQLLYCQVRANFCTGEIAGSHLLGWSQGAVAAQRKAAFKRHSVRCSSASRQGTTLIQEGSRCLQGASAKGRNAEMSPERQDTRLAPSGAAPWSLACLAGSNCTECTRQSQLSRSK